MLNTRVYDEAINHENVTSAKLMKVVSYCVKHGLELTTHDGKLCFRHRGYCTNFAITTKLQNGVIYR